MSPRHLLWLPFFALAFDGVLARGDERLPFIVGADISRVQQQEAKGRKWTDEGMEKDILTILKDHGFDWIRLRIFVNPNAEGVFERLVFGRCIRIVLDTYDKIAP